MEYVSEKPLKFKRDDGTWADDWNLFTNDEGQFRRKTTCHKCMAKTRGEDEPNMLKVIIK